MGLFTDLSVGVSGLKVSQHGLNTVAHNLSNVETEGFVRQQTLLRSSLYQLRGYGPVSFQQVGLGVDTEEVRQCRDVFLDKAYRQEAGRQGFYDSQNDAVVEIESIFGELQGVAFQDNVEEFWISLQELSKEPDSRVAQATLVETAVNFMERSNEIYGQLKKYQLDLNTQIDNQIDRINEIGDEIVVLNSKIAKCEAGGVENANDYRDRRNALLDELGQMVKITYKENMDRRVTVDIEGVRFVNDGMCCHMAGITKAEYYAQHGIDEPLDEVSGVLIPVWPHLDNTDVFDFSTAPNAVNKADVGGLKGAIAARGLYVGKYTDIPIEPKEEDFTDEEGYFDESAYKIAYDVFEENTKAYNLNVESSIVRMTQAQFDQLVHGIVTMINDALCPNKTVTVSAGTTITLDSGEEYTFEEDTKIKIFDEENAPVGVDSEATPGIELFARKSVNRYMQAQDITLADGTVLEGAKIMNWEDPEDNYSLYTLGELEVNPEILANKSKLPIISNKGTGDYDIAMIENLLKTWQEPFATLSPNTLTQYNVNAYYTAFTGAIAVRGDEYQTLSRNQESMTNSIDNQRWGIMGVSSDDEL
ncbi:MAG: flagellar hook-associated protein FlgK, partial [Lachnospiraceae bacterium]|nr:flagellar hook-associated protein FlgK [Lachnospiraceae bacterium]